MNMDALHIMSLHRAAVSLHFCVPVDRYLDHSGGLPRAGSEIAAAKRQREADCVAGATKSPPLLDVHPDWPLRRGVQLPSGKVGAFKQVISALNTLTIHLLHLSLAAGAEPDMARPTVNLPEQDTYSLIQNGSHVAVMDLLFLVELNDLQGIFLHTFSQDPTIEELEKSG